MFISHYGVLTVISKASRRHGWRSDLRTKWVLGGVGGGVARRARGGRVKSNLGEGEPKKVAVQNVSKFVLGPLVQMMQGFGSGDASDAHVFGKESLPIVGENVIKICIIWVFWGGAMK